MMIKFTEEEVALIEKLSKAAGGWKDASAADLVSKIREWLWGGTFQECCYCRISTFGWHKLSRDPEHILPKEKYFHLTFDPRNLNIACKRCNMGIKLQDDSFFLSDIHCEQPFKSELYTIIHPNLDNLTTHLEIFHQKINDDVILIYFPKTPKGEKTYAYFRLSEIEVASIDEAQGRSTVESELPKPIADDLEALLKTQ